MRIWAFLLLSASAITLPAQGLPSLQVHPYPGEPFTGQVTIFWTHHVGANTVVSQLVSKIARDGKGRLYRETDNFAVGPGDPQTTFTRTTVYDPIAGTKTECDLSSYLCRITDFQAPHAAIEVQTALPAHAGAVPNVSVPSSVLIDNGKHLLTVENLGERTIDDIPANGTRRTTSMAPDAASDDKSGASVIETWYSRDLHATLSETRTYSNGVILALKLTVQARAEPDPKTFATPNGFAIQDKRPPVDPRRSGGTSSEPRARIGGPVSSPVVIHQVEPQYTYQARAAKLSGNVLVNFVVDTQGVPQNVRVIRGFDNGLDQKAVEAVRQYRFKPAIQDGKPVAVQLNIEIRFQIF